MGYKAADTAGIEYVAVADTEVAVEVCLVRAVVDRDTMAVLDFEVVVALFLLLSFSFSAAQFISIKRKNDRSIAWIGV
jgi:hypothetical protein